MASAMSGLESLGSLLDDKISNDGTPRKVDISLIKEDENQPRKNFDEISLKELAASVATRGIKSPISVRPDPDEDGYFIINHGARRYRAAKIAGLSEVPVIIEKHYEFVDQIIENVQREDLKPIEIAMAIKKLLDMKYKKKQIAEMLGKSNSFVSQHFALLNLSEPIKKLFEDGKVTDVTIISELNSLYNKHPEEVKKFLEQEDEVTRSATRNLKDFLSGTDKSQSIDDFDQEEHNDGDSDDDSNSSDEAIPQAVEINTGEKNTESEKMKKPVVVVQYQGMYARLLLNKRPPSSNEVWIKFEEGGEIECVLCSDLKIASIIEG